MSVLGQLQTGCTAKNAADFVEGMQIRVAYGGPIYCGWLAIEI